jgi:hypothetical protein
MPGTARWQLACWFVGAALSLVGCNTSTCDRDADSLTVTNAEGVKGDNTWFSAPYHDPDPSFAPQGAPYQYLPAARTITFEHGLGSVPASPQVFLAFSEYGSLAPGSGNEDIIECMDDQVIQVKNDTCSAFYVWVAVQGSSIHALRPCKRDDLPQAGAAGVLSDAAAAPSEGGAAGASP